MVINHQNKCRNGIKTHFPFTPALCSDEIVRRLTLGSNYRTELFACWATTCSRSVHTSSPPFLKHSRLGSPCSRSTTAMTLWIKHRKDRGVQMFSMIHLWASQALACAYPPFQRFPSSRYSITCSCLIFQRASSSFL